MPVPKFQLVISEPAFSDFRDLLSFTLQAWGEKQFIKYKQTLDDALNAIAENPYRGRKRHGRMVCHVGRHKIFYRIDNSFIYVLRILHDRMDAVRHLPDLDSEA
jgi:toxin ParE1/3/4